MTRVPARTIHVLSVAICLMSLPSCSDKSTGPTQNSPFQGDWTFDIFGAAVGGGTCVVQANGSFTLNLDFTVGAAVYPQVITGSVRSTGEITATVSYQGSPIGNISGRLTGNTGSGTWQTTLAGSGTWTAARVDPNAQTSPFQGDWTFDISGAAVGGGTCAVQANGSFTLNLDFAVGGTVYPQVITGSVRNTGEITATVSYQGSPIGSISGTLTGNTGSGTWQTTLAGSGTWTATKVDPNVVANRPVIVRINFPAQIPAAAGTTSGTVEFSDPNADVTHAYFDVVSTTGSSFTPFDFDPGVLGRSSGSIAFFIGCAGPGACSGTTVLSVTLADAQGYRSQPVQFAFSYQ